ncbi:MAG TPA: hypothetical protein VD886_18425, partial [Herpetosiphonaceae bacterium]|nr:hypothetical protein [Herpetosiphonaceae bacterium]
MQRPGSRPLLNLLSRQARIGTWLFWGLAALAVAALLRLVPALLPEFGQPHWSLQGAGSFIAEGVYKTEYTADKQPFRWLSSASVLRLPLTAQPGTLKLRIQTGTAGGTPPRELIISGQEHIALAAHDEIRVYSLFVPQALAAQNQLSLELYSPRLDIPGEERDLGMRLWGLGWRRLDQNWPNGLWAGIALAGSLLGLAAILLRDWPARRQAAAARRPRSALAPAGSAAHGRWIDRTALFALALLYIALFSGHYYSFDG